MRGPCPQLTSLVGPLYGDARSPWRGERVYFFSGFVLDPDRAELRGPDGALVRLRPKTFELLKLFASKNNRVLGKQELMEAVWPDVHVGEDSLFQCIREIRLALNDDERQMVKLVSGRGYIFSLDVSTGPEADTKQPVQNRIGTRTLRRSLIASAGLGVLALLLILYFQGFGPFVPPRPVLELLPISAADDPASVALSRDITAHLVSGFSRIDGIDLIAQAEGHEGAARATYHVHMDLQKSPRSWSLQARLVTADGQEIRMVAEAEADAGEPDAHRIQSRLAAGIGYALASRLNSLAEAGGERSTDAGDVAVQQAIASINQTTRERFAIARSILEKHLAADPGNLDLQVALAGLHLRGMQMNLYDAAGSVAAETNARSLLEGSLRMRPQSMPLLGAYCRLLTVTNQFAESLVACAQALTVNPWDGAALYNLGLTQLQLGRFHDALAAFTKADLFDTPDTSRWTWLLGAGWANLLLGRNEEALDLLNRSIAITPGSGRPYLLLATAYRRLGRPQEAREALAQAIRLRPDATARNIALPTRHVSDIFLAASHSVLETLVEIGLPTGLPR